MMIIILFFSTPTYLLFLFHFFFACAQQYRNSHLLSVTCTLSKRKEIRTSPAQMPKLNISILTNLTCLHTTKYTSHIVYFPSLSL